MPSRGSANARRAGGTPTRRYERIINLDEENATEHAYLVAVETDSEDALFSAEDSLQELAALARTAGAEVVGTMAQRLKAPHPVHYVGKGRAEELRRLRDELEFNLIIVDDELTPAQQRGLERITDTRVIDRTALILDIFAQHAHTREGQLQVELAQLNTGCHGSRAAGATSRAWAVARAARRASAAPSARAVPARRSWRSTGGASARASPTLRRELEEVRRAADAQTPAAGSAGDPGRGHRRLYQRRQVHAVQRADTARRC